jgi:hypothetical protein
MKKNKYIQDNEYINSLPLIKITADVKIYYPDSVIKLLYKKIASLKGIIKYLMELINCWEWYRKIIEIKGIKTAREVIVIGNGPSQDCLNAEVVTEFMKFGGEIIVVNFWNENLKFKKIIPDYLVISDPGTLAFKLQESNLLEKNRQLYEYLKSNEKIKIICPLYRCEELAQMFKEERIIGFVDTELRMWTGNINPLFPRGYLSMTLYKALALAIWMGYKKLYIIGMDNTYPRNLYCSKENKLINHEIHAGSTDYAIDHSDMFKNISDALIEYSYLFIDAKKFTRNNIINLDQYSLTDAFTKTTINEWISGLGKQVKYKNSNIN